MADETLKALETRLSNAATSQERLDALLNLTSYWGDRDPHQALDYARQALIVAEETHLLEKRVCAYLEIAAAHFRLGDYLEGLRVASAQLEETNTPELKQFHARAHNLVGNCLHAAGDYTGAQEHYLELLRLAEELNAHAMVSGALVNIGIIYAESKSFDKAITYLQRGIEVGRATQMSEIDLAHRIHNLGVAYLDQGDYEQAIAYNLEALAVFEQHDDQLGIVACQHTLCTAYKSLEVYEKAHAASAVALQAARKAGSDYFADGYLPKQLGDLLIAEGKFDQAIEQLKPALPVLEANDDKPELKEAHRLLAFAYREMGCFQQALQHLDAYQELYEALFNEDSDMRLRVLQTRHEVERAELEAQVYRLKSDALEQAMAARQRDEAQRVAIAIERERGMALRELFTNTYHDLMTPITVMRTGLELMARLPPDDPRAPQRRDRIISQLDNLTDKLNMILLMAKLDGEKGESLQSDLHNVDTLIDRAVRLLRLDERARARVRVEIPHPFAVWLDGQLMTRALANLIDNALRFSPEPAPVVVSATHDEARIIIGVRDQGAGIAEADRPRIFERFFRGDASRSIEGGSGLGLPITQAIMRLHGGEIEVECEQGAGTCFRMVLPYDEADASGTPTHPLQ